MTNFLYPLIIITLIVLLNKFVQYMKKNKNKIKYGKKTKKKRPKTNAEIGAEGEKTVANTLNYVTYTNNYHVINDVLLFGGTDKSVQIDHVVVGRSGIYLIETKNYKGRIKAVEGNKWYQIPNISSNPIAFYSPEKQGLYHMYMLAEAISLKDKKHCHLITTVPNNTQIENHTKAKILHFNELPNELCSRNGSFLSNETVEEICKRIEKANTNNPLNLKKHINRVGTLYN